MHDKSDPNALTDPGAIAIHRFAEGILSATAGLPWVRLLPSRRRALGAYHFPGAVDFVRCVVDGMRRERALFADHPDTPLDPEAIMGHQERALGWRLVCNTLRDALQAASDAYLYEQAAAVQGAGAAVKQVRDEFYLPVPRRGAVERAWRYLALRTGALLLEQHHKDRQRAARMNKKERAILAGDPLPPMSKDRQRSLASKSAPSKRVGELLVHLGNSATPTLLSELATRR